MEEFLREIQEDVEREKYRALWQRYGKAAITLAVVAVVSTIGWQVWKSVTLAAQMKSTDALLAASTKNTADAWQEAAATLKGDAQAIAFIRAGKFADAEKAADDVALKSLARTYVADAAANAKEPFAPAILERQALEALRQGQVDTARQHLASISTHENAPDSLRERARLTSHFIEQHADAFKK
jgi:hypothetical protein